MIRQNKKITVGLALSGGGARGIAHIGVLAAMNKYGIYPDFISGTSMGAIVGLFYAAGFSPQAMVDLMIRKRKMHRIVRWNIPGSGLLDLKKLEALLHESLSVDTFNDLKMPFYCAVTNLNSGLCEYVSSGKVIEYVLASASVPVLVQPRVINGQTYVDGGLLSNLPVAPLKGMADLIIGVHMNHNEQMNEIKGMRSIAERCFRLAIGQNARTSFRDCNFVIDPPQVRRYSTFAFDKAREIYQLGFDETEQHILDFFSLIDVKAVVQGLNRMETSDKEPEKKLSVPGSKR